jgi:hypothetical protein
MIAAAGQAPWRFIADSRIHWFLYLILAWKTALRPGRRRISQTITCRDDLPPFPRQFAIIPKRNRSRQIASQHRAG